MSQTKSVLVHEIKELIPPTLYFFIILHVVALVRALMSKGEGIAWTSTASIAISALILGKAVLLADMLPFINRFPHKPLIWNVCWKAAIYIALALLLHYAEALFDAWRHAVSLAAACEQMLRDTVWPRVWAIDILLAVLVFNYCVLNELTRAVGSRKVARMFFGPTG